MKKVKGKIDYRHFICVAITLLFVLLAIFVFPSALGRIIESVRDFGLSIAFYFCKMFGIENSVTATVNDLPKMPFSTCRICLLLPFRRSPKRLTDSKLVARILGIDYHGAKCRRIFGLSRRSDSRTCQRCFVHYSDYCHFVSHYETSFRQRKQ